MTTGPALILADAERARGDGARRGWYEVFYVTAALGRGRAVWLRYTLRCPLDGKPSASLWGVAVDRARRRWFAAREDRDGAAWRPLDGGGVDLGGDVWLRPDGCRGALRDASGRAMRWDLAWEASAPPIPFFPERLERLSGGATYPIAAVPLARARGSVEIGDETIACGDVLLEQSHLFGGRHAARWGWLHALGFDGDADGFLTLVWARPRRLGGRTPAVSSLALRSRGVLHRGGGLRALRSVRWDDRGGEVVRFRGRAGSASVEGTVTVPVDALTGVTYHDPDGSAVHCAHCTAADLEVTVRTGDRVDVLRCTAACAFERGGRVAAPYIWRPL